MKKITLILAGLLFVSLSSNSLTAQEEIKDHLVVPFSDPGRTGTISVDLMNGGVTITGYEGNDVVIDATTRLKKIEITEQDEKRKGLMRIPVHNTGLTVEEEKNYMEIDTESHKNTVDLIIQVPKNCNLKVSCLNNGDVLIKNVEGEIEVENMNGKITLENVAGAVVAHAFNKDLLVAMSRVFPDKAMSFSSYNGDIDVTFPASIKADVKMKTNNGEVYSDFDIQLSKSSREVTEDNEEGEGKYRVKIDSAVRGIVNGGGQEIIFESYNGDIIIRKG